VDPQLGQGQGSFRGSRGVPGGAAVPSFEEEGGRGRGRRRTAPGVNPDLWATVERERRRWLRGLGALPLPSVPFHVSAPLPGGAPIVLSQCCCVTASRCYRLSVCFATNTVLRMG